MAWICTEIKQNGIELVLFNAADLIPCVSSHVLSPSSSYTGLCDMYNGHVASEIKAGSLVYLAG